MEKSRQRVALVSNIVIIDSHRNYIDTSRANRSLLVLMTQIRAAQTIGAKLTDSEKNDKAYEIYKKIINDMIAENMRDNFTHDQTRQLHEALLKANEVDSGKEKAWILRAVIDTVYDMCISDFNSVDSSKPLVLHKKIKNTINAACSTIHEGDLQGGFNMYLELLKKINCNQSCKQVLTSASMELVQDCIKLMEDCSNLEKTTVKARECLDRIYNEIRLPDVYVPPKAPQSVSPERKERLKKQGLLMVDFRQTDGSLFPYQLQKVDDSVMRGESRSFLEHLVEEQYLIFHGNVSRVNRGGFASFRMVPLNKDEMQNTLKNVSGFSICVKNLERQNKRYKLQLGNADHLKSFNWQSEFIVDSVNEFQTIHLDILTFWPTMFGHVLSAPGKVDINKVDYMGIIISHVTVDGKENPDFVEGKFGLAVRSISIIYENKN